MNNGTSTKLVQKKTTDCKFLAPTIAGFNEAACQVYQGGTWCPFPRTCEKLVKCLKNVADAATDTKIFSEYLEGAPNVTDDEVSMALVETKKEKCTVISLLQILTICLLLLDCLRFGLSLITLRNAVNCAVILNTIVIIQMTKESVQK